jgi:peptidylprolyl isomerase
MYNFTTTTTTTTLLTTQSAQISSHLSSSLVSHRPRNLNDHRRSLSTNGTRNFIGKEVTQKGKANDYDYDDNINNERKECSRESMSACESVSNDIFYDDVDYDVNNVSKNVIMSRRDFAASTTTAALISALFVGENAREIMNPGNAEAIGFQKELKPKRTNINDLNIQSSEPFEFRGREHAGVEFGDQKVGDGKVLVDGALATIHFDVKLRGLTVVSTRTARTLGGNRTVSEPLQFSFGKLPTEYLKPLKRKTVNGIGAEVRIDPELGELYVVKVSPDGPAAKAGFQANDVILEIDGQKDLANLPIQEIGALLLGPVETSVDVTIKKGGSRVANAAIEKYTLIREATVIVPKKTTANANAEGGGGLFNGETGPAVPPIIFVPGALDGMKVGGRRIIKTPSDLGYADQGEGEIPPGADIIVEVELLDVVSPTTA